MTGVDATLKYREEIAQGKLAATVEVPSRTLLSIGLLGDFWQSGARPQDLIIHLAPKSFPPLDSLRPHAQRQ
jgi:hypothetical protein